MGLARGWGGGSLVNESLSSLSTPRAEWAPPPCNLDGARWVWGVGALLLFPILEAFGT